MLVNPVVAKCMEAGRKDALDAPTVDLLLRHLINLLPATATKEEVAVIAQTTTSMVRRPPRKPRCPGLTRPARRCNRAASKLKP